MPASRPTAAALAARLTAAGLLVRVAQHPGHAHVSAVVAEDFPADSWRDVLAALEEADGFGLFSTGANTGRTLWAVIRTPDQVGPD